MVIGPVHKNAAVRICTKSRHTLAGQPVGRALERRRTGQPRSLAGEVRQEIHILAIVAIEEPAHLVGRRISHATYHVCLSMVGSVAILSATDQATTGAPRANARVDLRAPTAPIRAAPRLVAWALPYEPRGRSPRVYLLRTLMVRGLTSSCLGMTSVSTPLSNVASALSACTGMLSLNVRWNSPHGRSWTR